MVNVVLSLAALFLSIALLIGGSAMLGTLVSLRLEFEGFAETSIGLILAFYSIGFVMGATWGSAVIRSVGHIRAFSTYAAIACAVTLLHPLWVSEYAWAAMRLVMGFCLAGLMTVTESWINDRATNESRGKLLGLYTINFYMASALGQLLVGASDPTKAVAFSVVAILVVLSLVPLSLTRGLVPMSPSHTAVLSMRALSRDAPAGVTGVLVAGIAIGAFISLAPLYAMRGGLDTAELSRYMGFSVVCAILLQWPAGWLSDRLGRLTVLAGLLGAGSVAAMLVAFFGSVSTPLMFLSSGLFFAVATSMYPVSVALTNDQLPNDQLVAACAGLLRIYGVGTIAGPLIGAWLMGVFGAAALFVFISVCLLVGALAVQYRFRAADMVPLGEQGDYAPVVPVSSPVIVELDPRNEEFEPHHPGEPADWDIADHIEMLLPDQEYVQAEDGAAEGGLPETGVSPIELANDEPGNRG
ncbi:MFS transporter [Alcanivorax sp. 1008]|uniref:MFS transporter n=1 Tax=Alcanivorax sp. 1008 TaxID=2816853 RepID=UPI001D5C9B79|nr:MFS transporter [Alcanivorax sp. 1008]MCC1497109.1 MFS transporter [Alcanivorax sp. 1008]